MGSFNFNCALSGISILPGDKVKFLFLSRNPYDEGRFTSGCYYYDHWSLRTPPIDGVYDDYGRAAFDKNYLTSLIEELFQKDICDKPFGYNQYHEHPISKQSDISEIIEAAWEGRLCVEETGLNKRQEIDVRIPTWERIRKLLSANKFEVLNKKYTENTYNAIPIRYGIVAVEYRSYDAEKSIASLEKIVPVINEFYDCSLVYTQSKEYKNDINLLVVPKNWIGKPELFLSKEIEEVKNQLITPKTHRHRTQKPTQVAYAMVLEDVWKLFVEVKHKIFWRKDDLSVAGIYKKLKEIMDINVGVKIDISKIEKLNITNDEATDLISVMGNNWKRSEKLRELFEWLPSQITLQHHLTHAYDNLKLSNTDKEDLLIRCAEAGRVQFIMSAMHKAWEVPILAGQDPEYELHLRINRGLSTIIKQLKKSLEE